MAEQIVSSDFINEYEWHVIINLQNNDIFEHVEKKTFNYSSWQYVVAM